MNRTSCLVDFYNSYSFEGISVDGTHTQAENVADIGGLKQTFHVSCEEKIYMLGETQLFINIKTQVIVHVSKLDAFIVKKN